MFEVQEFDNVDDMLDSMIEDQSTADDQVQPWQAAIKVGDYCVRYYAGEVAIFIEVLDALQLEREAGASDEEVEYLRQELADEHMKNYRFGRCYSIMCPRGELGDTHISTISAVITKEAWEQAKANDWVHS